MRINLVYPFIYPPAPDDYNIPPTIYSLLNSIVNFDKEEQTKIKDLAKEGRYKIFDFNYPLTNKVNKSDFECMILNHFMMRRIGYETLTAFKLALNVKLNSIMPIYNKMFNMLDGWELFDDNEKTERTLIDEGSNTLNNTTTSTNTSDRRYSDTPQNNLGDVRNGTYVSEYNYDTDNGNVSSESNGNDSRNVKETIFRNRADKIDTYKKFLENRNSIYDMIFSDLDSLFYGLV